MGSIRVTTKGYKNMKQLTQPTVNTTPAKVEFDFEPYRAQLVEYVEDYKQMVVTQENIGDAKKAATELNKLSNSIKAGLGAHVKSLKEPADELNGYSKELQSIAQDGRSAILERVAVFEDETKAKAKELLEEFLVECRDEFGVRDEYRNSVIDDLIKLGSVNKDATKLTKGARDSVEALAKDEYSQQARYDFRVSSLENASYKAGLASPLTADDVIAFIHADDATWGDQLNMAIQRAVERQQQAERQAKEKFEREQAEKDRQREAEEKRKAEQVEAERKRDEQQRLHELQRQNEQQASQAQESFVSDEHKQRAAEAVKPVDNGDGTKLVTVTVTFKVKVKNEVPESAVANHVGRKLKAAEFEWETCHA